MKTYRTILTAVALLALPALGEAQRPGRMGGGGPGGGPLARSHVALLLEHKGELSLTADQVARLEAIDKKLEEKNKPLLEKARELRGEGAPGRMGDLTPEERQRMRERMQAARPVMEELRANREAARNEAEAVLTAEQRSLAQELVRQRQQDRPRRRAGRR